MDAALKSAMWDGFIVNWFCGDCALLAISKLIMFRDIVDDGKEWDIKRKEVWEETIGTGFPGENVVVLYHGARLTPEDLGNVTYGVIGRSYGFDIYTLLIGSYVAAGLPGDGPRLENELTCDQPCICFGYEDIFPLLYEQYYGG